MSIYTYDAAPAKGMLEQPIEWPGRSNRRFSRYEQPIRNNRRFNMSFRLAFPKLRTGDSLTLDSPIESPVE